MKQANVIVMGANGRMGKRICALVEQHPQLHLAAGATRANPLESVIDSGDLVIDFSLREVSMAALPLICKANKPLVLGTTGFTAEELQKVHNAGQHIPLVFAPNMSLGVNVLWALIEKATTALADFTITMEETHHVHKKDAPSGTAKEMLHIVETVTGQQPPCESKREGEVVGEHSITYTSEMESLTLSHSAKNRDVFAAGAVRAAAWLINKPAGFYSMKDVLGLS